MAIVAWFLVLAVGFVAFQLLPPTGPTYEVGMCLSGDVSATQAPDLRAVPCDEPHQYLVSTVIDPAVDYCYVQCLCPPRSAGYANFWQGGLEAKWRFLFGDHVLQEEIACFAPAE